LSLVHVDALRDVVKAAIVAVDKLGVDDERDGHGRGVPRLIEVPAPGPVRVVLVAAQDNIRNQWYKTFYSRNLLMFLIT
jgi:hypothetical protein